MAKSDLYRKSLRRLRTWDDYLKRNSGLPGPRGNLELAQVVAEEGSRALFRRWLRLNPERAPENTPEVFLAFCGVLGLGKLLAGGDLAVLPTLKGFASDPRWRIREGVAMALQHLGASDMPMLIRQMRHWSRGKPLEQRAAAAALCEPALLRSRRNAEATLKILDVITRSLAGRRSRRDEAFKILRQGLGYCWSVAVAACPQSGKVCMEQWLESRDEDVRWMLRENLRKQRLVRMDPDWVASCLARLDKPQASGKRLRRRTGPGLGTRS